MYELIAEYGMMGLGLILATLGGALTRYVLVHISSRILRDYLVRLWDELRSAVLEVAQTYTDAIKEARLDGKLTDEERIEAKFKAIQIAKTNFGPKGLKRLGRIFDIDRWMANKVEAIVRESKTPPSPKPKA